MIVMQCRVLSDIESFVLGKLN